MVIKDKKNMNRPLVHGATLPSQNDSLKNLLQNHMTPIKSHYCVISIVLLLSLSNFEKTRGHNVVERKILISQHTLAHSGSS